MVLEHFSLPRLRKLAELAELGRPIINRINAGQKRFESSLCALACLELTHLAENDAAFYTPRLSVRLNCIVSISTYPNRILLATDKDSSCLVPPPCHRAVLLAR